ncbi:hypothetical protein T439DRAFT_320510 [Meredithblackwellia eburnea MCA 4105]
MNNCDEGGEHEFVKRKQRSCCGWVGKCLCLPCYLFCSCALAGGAAGASHATNGREDDDPSGEPICAKCGLTYDEGRALQEARDAEKRGARTSHGANYFTNGMSPPPRSPAPSHQPRSAHSQQTDQFAQQRQQYYPPTQMQVPPQMPKPSAPSNPNRPEDEMVNSWLAGVQQKSPH